MRTIAEQFDYVFPETSIAQKPIHPRDAAKLLVYQKKSGKVAYSDFKHLPDFLPRRAVLVFNETKVIPARLFVKKETGGVVEILYIATKRGLLQVLANRKLAVGSGLQITSKLFCIVERCDSRFYYLRPSFPVSHLPHVLETYGAAPVPPYIKHSRKPNKKLREEYQTIFARVAGSIAAPTASLHFTKRLLADLKRRGFDIEFVTLHVGLGTFAPVTDAQMHRGVLHDEQYRVDAATARRLTAAKREGRPIIAVGTTVVRTLESVSGAGRRTATRHRLSATSGSTDLFIRPGYRFKFVDGIITNFHVPRSSLLMLVSAFASKKEILALYRKALRRKFRLFSFGDGMLLY